MPRPSITYCIAIAHDEAQRIRTVQKALAEAYVSGQNHDQLCRAEAFEAIVETLETIQLDVEGYKEFSRRARANIGRR